jgi:hypothetical protein
MPRYSPDHEVDEVEVVKSEKGSPITARLQIGFVINVNATNSEK